MFLDLKDGDTVDLKVLGLDPDQILIMSLTGSHMYGTSNEQSDRDYYGVYLPTRRQLLLNDYPKSVSLPKEYGLDLQVWSIHYFIKLVCQGETLSIDLLHSPDECIVHMDADIWYQLASQRSKFYTKNMKAFVSYARKQAVKYGLKGERIAAIEKVIEFLKGVRGDMRLWEIWLGLPKGNHINFLEPNRVSPSMGGNPRKMYQVCGKRFQETVKCSYIMEQLEKSLTEFGKRAKLAKENEGVDWKAISHAIRACDQVYDILRFGDFSYPLRTAPFIRNVKEGKLDFVTVVQPYLEESMDEVEEMMDISELPDTVDKEYWNQWLIDLMQENVL